MPMKLTVGLSKKLGESNYGSRGASIGLEVELDAGLLANPILLLEQIRQLYTLVRSAMTEELNRSKDLLGAPSSANGAASKSTAGNGRHNLPATKKQISALFTIAKNRNVDLKRMLEERFQIGKPDDLTIQQASLVIDELNKTP